MLASTSTPTQPEQADHDSTRTDHCTVEPVFWLNIRLSLSNNLAMDFLVKYPIDEYTCDCTEDHTNTD
jgi:hypothetical protein